MKIVDAQVHIWSRTVVPTFGFQGRGSDLEDVMSCGLCEWIGWDRQFLKGSRQADARG
jgi:hypothetical protein